MFVDPKQIDLLVKAVSGMEKARLVVMRKNDADSMVLQVVGQGLDPKGISEELTSLTKLRGEVEVLDALPNDGKVIDDQRDYSS